MCIISQAPRCMCAPSYIVHAGPDGQVPPEIEKLDPKIVEMVGVMCDDSHLTGGPLSSMHAASYARLA